VVVVEMGCSGYTVVVASQFSLYGIGVVLLSFLLLFISTDPEQKRTPRSTNRC
jgi:hypothetical protein